MKQYTILTATDIGDVIIAKAGSADGASRFSDMKREPDFGEFRLPTDEPRFEHALVSVFTNWCLVSGGRVLIEWDDESGRTRAWRFTAGGG